MEVLIISWYTLIMEKYFLTLSSVALVLLCSSNIDSTVGPIVCQWTSSVVPQVEVKLKHLHFVGPYKADFFQFNSNSFGMQVLDEWHIFHHIEVLFISWYVLMMENF